MGVPYNIVASVVVAAVVAFFAARGPPPALSLRLGRFFRDVSRYKARRRLYGSNEQAVVPFFLGRDKPAPVEAAESDVTVTRDELAEANGADGAPLWLSIRGRVYDVSAGAAKHYGAGKSYHSFVATDATRAFGLDANFGPIHRSSSPRWDARSQPLPLTRNELNARLVGCTQPKCVTDDVEGLTAAQFKEIDRWVELYETHDKYTFVGHLVDIDPVDAVIQAHTADDDHQADDQVDQDAVEGKSDPDDGHEDDDDDVDDDETPPEGASDPGAAPPAPGDDVHDYDYIV